MKKIKVLALCVACSLLLPLASCRDTASNKSGTRAGEESNGDTRGTEKPGDNEGSGSSTGATPSSENNDQ